MAHDEKFWLSLWLGLGTLLLLAIVLGIYSGYLDDKRDQDYVKQGLQPYTVTTCREYNTRTEWHEAGWHKPIETKSLTILTQGLQ